MALKYHPDAVILDMSMPNADGFEIIAALKKQVPQTRIVIYTVHTSPQIFHDCLAAGVDGYAVKDDEHANLITALIVVLAGKMYFSPSLCRPLAERYLAAVRAAPSEPSSWDSLTNREREVLRLTARGHTAKEMGKQLGLSPKTVRNHLDRVKQKLKVQNKSDLIRYALENELIRRDD